MLPQVLSLAGMALFAGLHAAAPLLPGRFTWGFDHWYLLPLPVRLGAAVVLALSAWLLYAGIIQGRRIWPHRFSGTGNRWQPYLITATAAAAVFWLFRIRTYFMGDGYLRLSMVQGGFRKGVVMTELLDSLFHIGCYRLLGLFGVTDPRPAYAVPAVIAGAVFVVTMMKTARALFRNSVERNLFVAFTVTGGYMLLFFGYAESYTVFAMLHGLYILAAVLSLSGRCSIAWPAAVFSLSLCFHLEAAALAPSLAVLIYLLYRSGTVNLPSLLKSTALPAVIPVLGAGLLAYALNHEAVTTFLHMLFTSAGRGYFNSSPVPGYSPFSAARLADFANQQVLTAPLAFIALPAFIRSYRQSDAGRRRQLVFLAVTFISALVFAFMFFPAIGMCRDWDLLAFPGIPGTVLGALLIVSGVSRSRRTAATAGIVAAVMLFHFIPWIMVNTLTMPSAHRFERLLASGGILNERNARMSLGSFYHEQGLTEKALHYYSLTDNPSCTIMMEKGMLYQRQGNYRQAIAEYAVALEWLENNQNSGQQKILIWGVRLDTLQAHLADRIGMLYETAGAPDTALEYYMKARSAAADAGQHLLRPDLDIKTANMMIELQRFREVVPVYESLLAYRPHYYQAWCSLATVYMSLNEYGKVEETLIHAIREGPESVMAYHMLGKLYEWQKRWDEARAIYRAALRHCPQDAETPARLRAIMSK